MSTEVAGRAGLPLCPGAAGRSACLALLLLASAAHAGGGPPLGPGITLFENGGGASAWAEVDLDEEDDTNPVERVIDYALEGGTASVEHGGAHIEGGESATVTVSPDERVLTITGLARCEADLGPGEAYANGQSHAGHGVSFHVGTAGSFWLTGSVSGAPPMPTWPLAGYNAGTFSLGTGGEPEAVFFAWANAEVGGPTNVPFEASGPLEAGNYQARWDCDAGALRTSVGPFVAPEGEGTAEITLTVSAGSCSGGELAWVGGRSGAFGDPENWEPEGVPGYHEGGACDTALFERSGNLQVDFAPALAAASRLAPRDPLRRDVGRVVVRRGTVQATNALLQLFDPSPVLDPSLVVESGGALLLGTGADVVAQDVYVGFGSSLELLDAFQFGCNRLLVDEGGRADVRAGLLTCESVWGKGSIDLEGSAAVLETSDLEAGSVAVREGARLEVHGGGVLRGAGPGRYSEVGEWGSEAETLFDLTGPLVVDGSLLTVASGGRLTATGIDLVGNGFLQIIPGGQVGVLGETRVGNAEGAGSLHVFGGFYTAILEIARGTAEVFESTGGAPVTAALVSVNHGGLRLHNGAQLETGGASVGEGSGVRVGHSEEPLSETGTPTRWTVPSLLSVENSFVRLFDSEIEAGQIEIGPLGAITGVGTLRVRSTPPFTGDGTVWVEGTITSGIVIDGRLGEVGGTVERNWDGTGSAPQLSPLAAALPRVARAKPVAPPGTPLVVTGDASLGGRLVLQFREGFAPAQGQPLRVLEVGGAVTGAFEEIVVQGLAPGAQFDGALSGGVFTVAATTATQALPPLALKAKTKLKETKAKGAKVKVARSGDRSQPLLVAYRTGGTAESGADYEALPGVLEIPAGRKSATIAVRPLRDGLVEPPETIEIELLPGEGYSLPRASGVEIELLSKDL